MSDPERRQEERVPAAAERTGPGPDRSRQGAPGQASQAAADPGGARGHGAPEPPRRSPDPQDVRERIVEALRTGFDPEIPVNIYDLGLIYEVRFDPGPRRAYVKMTLTSPACPVAGSLPGEVERKVASVEGVEGADVDLVWDPPWNMTMLSEAARLQLGF